MNDDELFTIEINIDTVPQIKENDLELKKENRKIDIEESVKELSDKLSELSKAAALIKKDNDDTFDRLREVIFSKNKGAIKGTKERFIDQAEEYAGKVEEPTPFVPFKGFWPTYEMMSASQLRWYFFWRSRVRNSDYPETSVSYIFLYCYEIINGIGVEDDCDGFIKLCAVWSNYRKKFVELDSYLKCWTADYIAIHFGGKLPDFILKSIGDYSLIEALPSDAIFKYIINNSSNEICGEHVAKYIQRFSTYAYNSSSFFKNNDIKKTEDELVSALRFIDSYLIEQSGKGIIETYIPEIYRKVNRVAYVNAIYNRKPKYAETYSFDCTGHKELRMFITVVYKHVENIIRLRNGKKNLLKVELPKDITKAITKHLSEFHRKEEYEKRTKIEVDASKIKDLIKSSNEIRDKLLEGGDEVFVPQIQDIIDEPKIVEDFSDTGSEDFASRLSELQAKIILFINDNNGSVSDSLLSSNFRGSFVQMEIDVINEISMDFYGDILIVSDGDLYTIQEF